MPRKDLEATRKWARLNRKRLNSYAREYRKKRPSTWQKQHFRTKYGITLEQYESMVDAQGGLCAICEKPETKRNRAGGIRRLAVDHDHQTGVVRALLCGNCNNAIGHMQESTEIAQSAVNYLRKHKETQCQLVATTA